MAEEGGKFNMRSLGMEGLRKAPLKIIMKIKTPKKTPWGEEPGRKYWEEVTSLYLRVMFLPVRKEQMIRRSKPGTCMSKRSVITCW